MDLNNLEEIRKLDPKNVYGSTEMLADQCTQIWEDVKKIKFEDYSGIKNIIICGMGGSAYGGHVSLSLFKNDISLPLYVNSDYDLPAFASKDSLIILTSYSGGTEEVLSCLQKAKDLGAKMIGLTTGGQLKELLSNSPCLIVDPKFNPSGQPRLGTGYIIVGTMTILSGIGQLKVTDSQIKNSVDSLIQNKENVKNQAVEISKKIYETIPLLISGGIFEGNIHILRNQLNETAKIFSAFAVIPELNHHLMEGLKNPNNKKLISLFFPSDLYDENIKKRLILTKEVIEKNNMEVIEYKPSGQDKISQMLNILAFGGYLSLFTSLLYNQDPSLIPWVDYFKKNL